MYWIALFFFQDLLTHFHDFWSQNGVVILVMPRRKMEQKSVWFCSVKPACSNFKVVWEKGVWTIIRFLARVFLHAANSLWFLLCFRFLGSDFFLIRVSSPLIVPSRPIFWFEPNFQFSLVFFLFKCGLLKLIFCFFYFLSDFLRNRFPNSLIVFSRSIILLREWKFFELYVMTCPAMFFFVFVD